MTPSPPWRHTSVSARRRVYARTRMVQGEQAFWKGIGVTNRSHVLIPRIRAGAGQGRTGQAAPPAGGASVLDRLIRERPEVAADVWRAGRRPGLLGQQDRDQLLARVGAPRRAQAAVPAVRPDRPGHVG